MSYLPVDDSHLIEDTTMLIDYMEEIRNQTIEKLTPLEIAALFENFSEFRVRLNEERELNRYAYYEE